MSSDHGNWFSRRNVLKVFGAGSAAFAALPHGLPAAEEGAKTETPPKGRIKQGICRGCLKKAVQSLDEAAQICVKLGLKGIDLVGPNDWGALKKHNLLCTMVPSHKLAKGLNHKENHAECVAAIRKGIDDAAGVGFPNVICFSGNRAGIDGEEGLKNCVEGLKQVVGHAEQKGVTLCMELLNSKRNHKDYQCDHTAWGAELCKRVGSPRFKLLYDIFHMQIMEGDVIATLKENIQYIGHVHTAGVPGRHEIDETQELYYPAIMRALVEAGYQGYVSHEYTPVGDPIPALEKAVRICDV